LDEEEGLYTHAMTLHPCLGSDQRLALLSEMERMLCSGGQAVIAHPGRYRVSPIGMRKLLSEFAETGGDGIEILSPSHTPAQYTEFATHARVLGLRGSCGSDWHGPGENWMDLGDLPDLPGSVVPIWKNW